MTSLGQDAGRIDDGDWSIAADKDEVERVNGVSDINIRVVVEI